MRLVIQRVKKARVLVAGKISGHIKNGLLLFVGITHADTSEDVDYLVKKVSNLRIFEDDQGKMNISLLQNAQAILSVSQFTLYADLTKGNRPSFGLAAKPEQAMELYKEFNEKLRSLNIQVETGIFGEMMEVDLINDGPVTIILDSKQTHI